MIEVEGFVQINHQPQDQEQQDVEAKIEENEGLKEEAVTSIRNEAHEDLSTDLNEAGCSYKSSMTSRDSTNIEIIQKYLKCLMKANVVCVCLRVFFFVFAMNLENLIITSLICYWQIHVLLSCAKTLKLGLNSKRSFEQYDKTIKKVNYQTKFFFYLGIVSAAILIIALLVILVSASNTLSRSDKGVARHIY